jgi:hypothetical protein
VPDAAKRKGRVMTALKFAYYRNVAEKLDDLSRQILRESNADRDVSGSLKALADAIRADTTPDDAGSYSAVQPDSMRIAGVV